MDNIEEAQTLKDKIYALEPLSYYFNMKPKEFWNASYREVIVFCNANSCRLLESMRNEVNIQEEVTNKLIQANPLLFDKPKIKSLLDTFKNLFKKEEKNQTLEEQRRILKG